MDILVSESTWKRGGAGFQVERMGVVRYSLKGRGPGPATVFPERTGT